MFSQAENQIFWFESFSWENMELICSTDCGWNTGLVSNSRTAAFDNRKRVVLPRSTQNRSFTLTGSVLAEHKCETSFNNSHDAAVWTGEMRVFCFHARFGFLKKTFFGRRKAKNETNERRCSVASVSIPDNKVFKHHHDWSFHFFLNSVSIF